MFRVSAVAGAEKVGPRLHSEDVKPVRRSFVKSLARYFRCFTPRFMSPQDLVRCARSVRGELGCPCCSAAPALPLALPFALEPSFRLLCVVHASLFTGSLDLYLPTAPSRDPRCFTGTRAGRRSRRHRAQLVPCQLPAPPGGLVSWWGCPAAAPSRSGASSAALGQSHGRHRAACSCCRQPVGPDPC